MAELEQTITKGAFVLVVAFIIALSAAIILPAVGVSIPALPDFAGGEGADGGSGIPTSTESNNSNGLTGPTPLVVDNTQVVIENHGTISIRLGRAPTGLQSFNISIVISDGNIANITAVSAGDAGPVTVIHQSAEKVTFTANDSTGLIGSTNESVVLGNVTVTGKADGATDVQVLVHELRDQNGEVLFPETDNGRITVRGFPPFIRFHNQSTFDNQSRFGTSATVRRAYLPDGGFIVIYRSDSSGSTGTELGRSSYLERGGHEEVRIDFDQPIFDDQRLIARLHKDTNTNQLWDGQETDTGYTVNNDTFVEASAVIKPRVISEVDVELTNGSRGLSQYEVRLSADTEDVAFIRGVSPKLLTGQNFEIVGGGERFPSVRVRAVDLNNEVNPFAGNRVLFTVRFESTDQLDRSELQLTVLRMIDNDGSGILPQNVTLSIQCHTPFDGPIPGTRTDHQPRDPDCDGLFEDVNGDGEVTIDDVRELSFINQVRLSKEQIAAFDFDGDGDLAQDDAQTLKSELEDE